MLTLDIIYIAAVAAVIALHLILKKLKIDHPILRFIAFVPLLGSLVSIAGIGFEICLIPAYIGSLVYAAGFGLNSSGKFIAAAAVSAALAVSSFIPCLTYENYRRPDYIEEFDRMFSLMKRHYVLSDYKKPDWDGIYAKYSIQVSALKRNDDQGFRDICYKMATEFHDPHIQIIPFGVYDVNGEIKNIQRDICGNDCGFASVRLSDGRIVACCVSDYSDAYAAGLRNGCELVSFNGMEINDYINSVEPVFTSFADIDNIDFFRPISAFGIQEDSARIGFINEDGEKTEADIKAYGPYANRIQATRDRLFGKPDEYYNFSWRDLGNGTACFVLSDFMNDPTLRDEEMMQKLREMIDANVNCTDDDIPYPFPVLSLEMDYIFDEWEEAGIDKLVIDLRNNGGGSLSEIGFIASYFTDEPLYLATEEYRRASTGEIIKTKPEYTEDYGKKRWKDGEIVILVSSDTASAAEVFTRAMSTLPNVKVIGLTDTAGCAMGVSTVRFDRVMCNFPMYKMLDENGNILIDSGTDLQSSLEIDEKLEFDEDTFRRIFLEGEDYALTKAVEYLSTK